MGIEFLHISEALRIFASAKVHQSQEHIKPAHRHIALRMVLEGGFLPEEVTPHPPLKAQLTSKGWILEAAPEKETTSESTVFGGMKTKQIDVVVAKHGVGPVIAISVKGTFRAYRNLVNRMEEAIGDSTNLHVMYPGLVYGFLSLIRANREKEGYIRNDMGIARDGNISGQIQRYYAALSEMTGRRFVRNDFTRYESVGLALVENDPERLGLFNMDFPPSDSMLRIESFFRRLYEIYDIRFPLRAEYLKGIRRFEWLTTSPLFAELTEQTDQSIDQVLGYLPRIKE
jgi:hypothetical protein